MIFFNCNSPSSKKFATYKSKIIEYHAEFLSRSKSYTGSTVKENITSQPFTVKIIHGERLPVQNMSFEINVNIKSDKETLEEILKYEMEAILARIELMRESFKEPLVTDYLRDSKGRKLADAKVFGLWSKCLFAHDHSVKNGYSLAEITKKLLGNKAAFDKKAAENYYYRMRKLAKEMIRRAEIGTFPFDEHGKYDLK